MISITIISDTFEQSDEIIRLLLDNRLVIDGTIKTNTRCYKLDTNKNVVVADSVVLLCTTKALLFSKIDEFLRERYKNNLPVIHSVPIVNMDWEQSKTLVEKTQSI